MQRIRNPQRPEHVRLGAPKGKMMSATYCVFWRNESGDPDSKLHDEMVPALAHCEQLRNSGNRFVTMAYENTDMVGKQGVDVTGPDYDWKKRRV